MLQTGEQFKFNTMKNTGKLMVYFDLNEIIDLYKSSAIVSSKEANTAIFNEFREFITSYAPYSIVSDIAANMRNFSDGEDRVDSLDAIVNLSPTHLMGRIFKNEMLSLARAGFWFGFFEKDNNKELSSEEFNLEADKRYDNLKRYSALGYNEIARYFSFLFANRDITITQITTLSSLVNKWTGKLDTHLMGAVLVLSTFVKTRDELEKTVIKLIVYVNHLLDRVLKNKSKVLPPLTNKMSKLCMTNFILLCKSLELLQYTRMEEDVAISFLDLFKMYLGRYMWHTPIRAAKWLYAFAMSKHSEVTDFCDEVAKVMELK